MAAVAPAATLRVSGCSSSKTLAEEASGAKTPSNSKVLMLPPTVWHAFGACTTTERLGPPSGGGGATTADGPRASSVPGLRGRSLHRTRTLPLYSSSSSSVLACLRRRCSSALLTAPARAAASLAFASASRTFARSPLKRHSLRMRPPDARSVSAWHLDTAANALACASSNEAAASALADTSASLAAASAALAAASAISA